MPQQPEQQAPPVQRLRVRYAKRGRMRFTSHRDFARAFERAVFRARIPMAYSSGFNPHPRISYAGAAPTGSASEAEYLELALAQEVDADRVARDIDDALPTGLDILDVVPDTDSPVSGASLADLLQASVWTASCQVGEAVAAVAVRVFLDRDSVLVERMTKKGLRSFDCRAAVLSLTVREAEASPAGSTCLLVLVLRHTVPAVRPDDVLAGLRAAAELDVGEAPLFTRLAQGRLVDGLVTDPLRRAPPGVSESVR